MAKKDKFGERYQFTYSRSSESPKQISRTRIVVKLLKIKEKREKSLK